MKVLRETQSLCPECVRLLPARVFEEGGKIWITKTCPKHGETRELYWGDAAMYYRASGFAHDGKGIACPNVKGAKARGANCPFDCGLCSRHKSHTALANIVLTNRCDLQCWYCFFYRKRSEPVYEPTLKQIKKMLRVLKKQKPVAPNAIQLSLDYGERVLLKTPQGLIVSRKIGEFVDEIMHESKPKTFVEPIPHEASKASGWQVLSIDEKLGVAFKPISAVIRHENVGELFELETDCGWRIRATGSHSVFVLGEDASASPKSVSELKKDDVLLGALNAPRNESLNEIDFLSLVVKKTRENPALLKKVRVCGFTEMDLKDCEKEFGREINWDSVSLKDYLRSKTRKGSRLRYFNSRKGKELPFVISLTPELCRLLGYYAGKGCLYQGGVIFTFGSKEHETINDFLYCVKKVFGSIDVRQVKSFRGLESAAQFYIEGHLYKLFFELLDCGKEAIEKRVPWLFFNTSTDFKKEFLRAYFKCDGNVNMRKTGFEINHNTVSKELAADLVLLHAQLGIVTKIEESVSKPHLVKKTSQWISSSSRKYRVIIGGKTELEKSLWYLEGKEKKKEKKKFEEYVYFKERHAPSFQRIPLITAVRELANAGTSDARANELLTRIKHDKSISKQNLVEVLDAFKRDGTSFAPALNDFSHSDLGVFKIRRVKKIKPSTKDVYDLSVPGSQAFFAGLGPLLAHNTGGEPTLRDDLIEVIKACRRAGFEHVQLNTNGIQLAQDPELARAVSAAGCKTIYLSFDGVTPQTNPKNHWEIPRILENCRKAGLGVVLVPTLIKGVNDHEIAEMINFAFDNIDVVRSINFQPVSIVGMVPRAQREKMRITIPDAILAIEKQTHGEIARFDFFPVPSVAAVTHFAEALSGKPQYELSTHFACGMGTYVFKEGEEMIPVTRFIDVPRLFELLEQLSADISRGKPKALAKLEFVYRARKAISKERMPKTIDFQKMLFDALLSRNYRGLADFHKHSLFIGMMHFMDLYNYDVERVERCCIHYATPDGRVVPFCAFNVVPQFYRDAIQKKYAVPRARWERAHKRRLADDFYKRVLPEQVPEAVEGKEVGHAVDLMK